MQTEPQTEEVQQPTPEEEHRGLLPDEEERKKELQAKQAQKEKRHETLTKAEAKELEALLTIESLEKERQAAIHYLSEAADKYGRKEIARIRREVTDQVKVLSADEQTEVGGILKIYRKAMADADKELRQTMQKIQEEHNKLLASVKDEMDKDERGARERYRTQYDEFEAQLNEDVDQVSSLIGTFIQDIKKLELEQLQELLKAGIVQIGGGKERDYLVVPGSGK